MNNQEFLAKEITEKLVGTTINNAVISKDKEEVGFQVVKKAQGRGNYEVITVWIMCDPEGNGAGFLSIE